MKNAYIMQTEIWIYPSETAAWHFVSIPKEISEKIKVKVAPQAKNAKSELKSKAKTKAKRRGFGAVRVKATIGKSSFETSLFPSRQSGTYIMPIKKEIRRKEAVQSGDTIKLKIEVL